MSILAPPHVYEYLLGLQLVVIFGLVLWWLMGCHVRVVVRALPLPWPAHPRPQLAPAVLNLVLFVQVLGIIELRFVIHLYIRLLVVFLDFAMLRFMVVHLMAQLAITYAAVLLVIVIRFLLYLVETFVFLFAP